MEGDNAESLGLTGKEYYSITGIASGLGPASVLHVTTRDEEGKETSFRVLCRLDSQIEVAYYENGGILHYVLRNFLKDN